MKQLPISKYPDAFYRVSLKAIIQNDKGEVLCVKEDGSEWSLPGGGLDYGESIEQGLVRELHEEAALDPAISFTFEPIGHEPMWVESRQAWQLWVVFRITFTGNLPEFSRGVDADDVAFVDPTQFKDSPWRVQRLAYKWCVDLSYDTGSLL
jgi:ADP-ribose pyrophosphatase YjhB (NUDIX family)